MKRRSFFAALAALGSGSTVSAASNPLTLQVKERNVLRFGKWKYHWLGWERQQCGVLEVGFWVAFKDGDDSFGKFSYSTTTGVTDTYYIGSHMNTGSWFNERPVTVTTPQSVRDEMRFTALANLLKHTGKLDAEDPIV